MIDTSMIKSFKCRETEKIWHGKFSKKLPEKIQNVARRKLRMINNSSSLEDLKIPPANMLEKLKGNRKNRFSIRINKQYRICFSWESGNCSQVEIVDYH